MLISGDTNCTASDGCGVFWGGFSKGSNIGAKVWIVRWGPLWEDLVEGFSRQREEQMQKLWVSSQCCVVVFSLCCACVVNLNSNASKGKVISQPERWVPKTAAPGLRWRLSFRTQVGWGFKMLQPEAETVTGTQKFYSPMKHLQSSWRRKHRRITDTWLEWHRLSQTRKSTQTHTNRHKCIHKRHMPILDSWIPSRGCDLSPEPQSETRLGCPSTVIAILAGKEYRHFRFLVLICFRVFFFSFWPYCMACKILVPQLGI